ncbi:MAG TPA: exonuclease domain-containing protein [Longimicrobiales bacterium]|nr:exonuclease domain-containing protein [Longimicrobiales bacterium]
MHDVAGEEGGRLVGSAADSESAVDGRDLWFADRSTRLAAARVALRIAEERQRTPESSSVREPAPMYAPLRESRSGADRWPLGAGPPPDAARTPHADGAGAPPAPVPWGLRPPSDRDSPAPSSPRPIEEAAPLRELEYAVVDVETTGGSGAFGHRVTEVGVVCLRGDGRFLGELRTLVNPHRPIPATIRRLTNISQAMVEAAPDFSDIADAVQAALRGRVVVAHNAGFDWRFLHNEFALCRRRLRASERLCTVRLSRRLVPEVRSRSLDALSRYFGIPNEARHRAWGDARATAALLVRLIERAEERAAPTLADVRVLLRPQERRSRRRSALPRSMDWA